MTPQPNPELTRPVPYNTEAEDAVIGSVLIDPDTITRLATFLKPADFYREKNGWIYQACLTLSEQDAPIDTLTVADELERVGHLADVGGVAGLTELYMRVPTAIHAIHYGGIVSKHATFRRLIGAAESIAKLAYNPGEADLPNIRAMAEAMLAAAFAEGQKSGPRHIRESLYKILEDLVAMEAGEPGMLGLPSSLSDLQTLLGGYQRGEQTVLVARPAVGKSALAAQEAYHLASRGNKVLIFSLEMSEWSLGRRIVALAGGINYGHLRLGLGQGASAWDWAQLHERAGDTVGKISEMPLYLDTEASQSAYEIRAKAKALSSQLGGLDFIAVDYLGLLRMDRNSKTREDVLIGEAAKLLRETARELNCHLLLLHQLNREGARGVPSLHHIGDSGQIERHADVVLAIHDPELAEGQSSTVGEGWSKKQVLALKARNSAKGFVDVLFSGNTQQWRDEAYDWQQQHSHTNGRDKRYA